MPRLALEPLVLRQAQRFLVVGMGSVAIDSLTYFSILRLGGPPTSADLAKTLSFVAGTIFAFLANKSWTFESHRWSLFEAVSFCVLYAATMIVNVGVNHRVLETGVPHPVLTAFLCATAVSTVLNFLGQKFIAFRKAQEHLRILRPRR